MDKKLTALDAVVEWRVEAGPNDKTIALILDHTSIDDLRAGLPAKRTPLILTIEQAIHLSDALSGRTAATPKPERYDA